MAWKHKIIQRPIAESRFLAPELPMQLVWNFCCSYKCKWREETGESSSSKFCIRIRPACKPAACRCGMQMCIAVVVVYFRECGLRSHNFLLKFTLLFFSFSLSLSLSFSHLWHVTRCILWYIYISRIVSSLRVSPL